MVGPTYFQSFLRDHTFLNRIGSTFSNIISLENAVPQGSCISKILFLLVINEIGENVTFPLITDSADDYSMCIKSSNLNRSNQLLLDTLNLIQVWSNGN